MLKTKTKLKIKTMDFLVKYNSEILTYTFYGTALLLIVIGFYGVLVKKNLVKLMLSLSIVDSGVNLMFIAIGFIKNGTAPIFSPTVVNQIQAGKAVVMVDPIPQALVLTAIVIGFGVTAVGLALALRLYRHHNTTNIDEIKNLKW